MSETHLLCALRYVELNPVRAGMTAQAMDWPWSSAQAHTSPTASDGVLCCDWIEYFRGWNYAEWAEILAAGMTEEERATVRRSTRTGEPLGSEEFVSGLERKLGRRLRIGGRGRPRKKQASKELHQEQGLLFEAAGE